MIDWDTVYDAYDEWAEMTPDERRAAYDEFFEEWDMTGEEMAAFFEMYREDS